MASGPMAARGGNGGAEEGDTAAPGRGRWGCPRSRRGRRGCTAAAPPCPVLRGEGCRAPSPPPPRPARTHHAAAGGGWSGLSRRLGATGLGGEAAAAAIPSAAPSYRWEGPAAVTPLHLGTFACGAGVRTSRAVGAWRRPFSAAGGPRGVGAGGALPPLPGGKRGGHPARLRAGGLGSSQLSAGTSCAQPAGLWARAGTAAPTLLCSTTSYSTL